MVKLLIKMHLLVLAVLLFVSSSIVAQTNNYAVRDIRKIKVNEQQLRDAVASRTLTWLTGSSSNNDHISVGRMANYFGFVGLRVASGHSLTRSNVATDTLAVLNQAQRDALISLIQTQKTAFEETQKARQEMNRALEDLLVGEYLSQNNFLELGRAYGESEALLGEVAAQKFGDVAQTLTSEQKESLAQIRAAHISGQGHEIKRRKLRLRISREEKQELVNIAARFLSWTTGTPEYNNFEVVGKPSQHFGFVSLRKESNHGIKRGDVAKEVVQMLTHKQVQLLDVAAAHNVEEFGKFLNARSQLMRTFEAALSGDVIDTDKIRRFGTLVGELEAGMTWAQATAMLQVRHTMADKQIISLLKLRDKYVAVEDTSLPDDPVERGRQLFAQCSLCHNKSNHHAIGPNLVGIVGRGIATDSSFDGYSTALRTYAESEQVWTEAILDNFLKSPRTLVPSTFMGFDGLEQRKDRAAVIAYLKTLE